MLVYRRVYLCLTWCGYTLDATNLPGLIQPIKMVICWMMLDGLLLGLLQHVKQHMNQWEFRDPIEGGTLVSTIFLAMFSRKIPWNLGLKHRTLFYGSSNENRFLKREPNHLEPSTNGAGKGDSSSNVLSGCCFSWFSFSLQYQYQNYTYIII